MMEILFKDNKLNYSVYIFHYLSYLILFSVFIILYQYEITICLYKNITGNNCYGCGMTRAIFLALKGQIIPAVLLNWRVSIVLPILIILWYKQMNYTLYNLLTSTLGQIKEIDNDKKQKTNTINGIFHMSSPFFWV